MAKEFKLLFVLCLVVSRLVSDGVVQATSAASSTASVLPSTTGGDSSPTPSLAVSSTTAGGDSSPTPSPAVSSTTAGGDSSPTPSPAAASTTAGGDSSPTPSPAAASTTAGGDSSPTPSPAAGSTTAGGDSSPTPSPAAGSTTAGGDSSPTPSPAAGSTTAGGDSSPTPSPAAGSTTAGGDSSPTPSPAAGSTTAGGDSSPTPSPAVSSTTAGEDSNSTTSPAVNSTTPPPEPPSDPCELFPCGDGSTCDPRANSTRLCLCLAGALYNDESQSCVNAKVFPGELEIKGLEYSSEMGNTTSKEFLDAAVKINNALEETFKSSDFSGSTVLEIRQLKTSRVWSRSGNGVNATVEIFFKASSTITEDDFLKEMETAASCSGCLLQGSVFTESKLCDNHPCDENTTSCTEKDGAFSCDCKDDYVKTDFSERLCIACPSGEKASKDHMHCEDCPFGYSGLNCNESWQLILVIVGSVLGGLLLITLIVLPVVALKSPKKSSKKSKYAAPGESYNGPLPVKAPLGNSGMASSQAAPVNGSANAFANAGMPRIPRATTPNSWDRTNLEMTPTNSRQNLVSAGRNSRLYEDDDDMAPYAQSRPQSSFYGQSRPQSSLYGQAQPQSSLYGQAQPQNNPYAQSRPQANPYASSQGLSNPYYTHDNGRRFN